MRKSEIGPAGRRRKAEGARAASPRGQLTRSGAGSPASRRTPRQDRGQRRVEKVLDAAESVIAEVGIDHATTNAIAARAGSGMGSLYHFFPNKEAIVQALSERYSRRMRALVDYPSRPELAGVPLARLADLVVDPLVAFMRRSPAYWHVFHAAHAAGTTGACEDDLYQVIVSNVDVLIGARAPHVTPARRRVLAMVMVELVHALLAAAFQAPAKQRRPIIRETKRLLALHAEMIQNGDDPLQRLR